MTIKPPKGIPLHIWDRIPLAKRRLLTYGPMTPGRDAFRDAVVAVAAELSLHGITEEVAVRICRKMPFVTGATSDLRVRRGTTAFVRWAYHAKDGEPVYSGCPRITHTSGNEETSRMRGAFEPFCDAECAATCAAFAYNVMPETKLLGTEYFPAISSAIWTSPRQGGLDKDARTIYAVMASIAVATKSDTVWASANYITQRLDGALNTRMIGRRIVQLRSHNLLVLRNKHRGEYWVPVPSPEFLEALEVRLGVSEARRWNRREAAWQSLRKAEMFPTWSVEEALGSGGETTAGVLKAHGTCSTRPCTNGGVGRNTIRSCVPDERQVVVGSGNPHQEE
jgi:hypothetical protein